MAEYTGKRIVPRHCGVWDKSRAYETLSIVLDEATGDSYISRRGVPAGTALNQESYWALSAKFSSQMQRLNDGVDADVEEMKSFVNTHVATMEGKVTAAQELTNSNKAALEKRMGVIESRLDENVTASTEPEGNFAAEVVDARVDAEGNSHDSLGKHLQAIESGETITALDGGKVWIPEATTKRLYELASSSIPGSTLKNLDITYDKDTRAIHFGCIQDDASDVIIYMPLMTARQFARIYSPERRLKIAFETENCQNSEGDFKIGLWLLRMQSPDTLTRLGRIYATDFSYTFEDGSHKVEGTSGLTYYKLVYNPDGYYEIENAPVTLGILLYANSPKAGEEVTLKAENSLIKGLAPSAVCSAYETAFLREELETLDTSVKGMKEDLESADTALREGIKTNQTEIQEIQAQRRYRYRSIPFVHDSIFPGADSVVKIITDEFGDEAYHIEYKGNNPMYQMNLTNLLGDDCREFIVEVTARRLSEEGQLRVQAYDPQTGYSQSGTNKGFPITKSYRKYQFRLSRKNAGPTALGIGPATTSGNIVEFKKVTVLIPDESSKQISIPLKHYYGYLQDLNFKAMETVKVPGALVAGTDDFADADDLYLDTVEIYSTIDVSPTFVIGCVDQHGLLQESATFIAHLKPGRNFLKCDDKQIPVPAGYGVFMKWPKDEPFYVGETGTDIHGLVSTDTNYYSDDKGYSGYPLKEMDCIVPLRFTLREKWFAVEYNEVKKGLETAQKDIADLKQQVGTGGDGKIGSLRDPQGVKFALSVNADGSLSTIRSIPKKVAVYGNSLTLGFGTFGMAASDSKHDWYHFVEEFLKGKNPDVQMKRSSASEWEGLTTSETRKSYVQETMLGELTGEEDLIIIQLSDNVNTDEKKKTYPADVRTLFSLFRAKCPRARIVWVVAWYNWSANYAAIEKACTELGTDLVDIRDLSGVKENQSAVGNTWTGDDGSQHTIDSTGVASHPGDAGMKKISDRIIELLESYM